ncbi:MAG: hypothetical protein IGS03_15705 [Candidatus Sericytochromatia bacterium]|nr:hypothetical protein [Candidatus Sericytochromatia bacterium]
MSLEKVGVNSLLAVNSWIGVINANMQSSGRTGYKPTRITMADGLGINRVSDVRLPPSTLTVQATRTEWGQGAVVNSEASTHFALNGEGFFVLHDTNSGKYYLSRDGEFHWGNEGYLVNSAGLKVVSAGQDYIRYTAGDESDMLHIDGFFRDLETYGNKSFLLVDVMNRDALRMSQYGSTIFEVDGGIPLRVRNDFTVTTDGLTFVYEDPAILAPVSDPGFISGATFDIDFGNGNVFDWNTDRLIPGQDILDASIDDIVASINAWGATLPGGQVVTADFDTLNDRLILTNSAPIGQSNQMRFGGGPNGNAFREFFKLNSAMTKADITTGGNNISIVTSREDIDNSQFASFLDIGFAGSILYPALPTSLTIAELTTPGATVTANPVYNHNKNAGYVESIAGARNSMVIGQSTVSSAFELELLMQTSDNGEVVFGFGQKDPLSFNSGGFDLVYDPVLGDVTLRSKPRTYGPNEGSTVIATANVNAIGVAPGTLNTAPISRVVLSLSPDNSILTFSVDGSSTSFSLLGAGQEISGHLSLRHSSAGGNHELRVHSLYANFKGDLNAVTTGEMVSVSQLDISNSEIGAYRNRPKARVLQSALESSTASLTEYLPMLSLAQKVFSSISKIISTYNQTVDDLNTLIR